MAFLAIFRQRHNFRLSHGRCKMHGSSLTKYSDNSENSIPKLHSSHSQRRCVGYLSPLPSPSKSVVQLTYTRSGSIPCCLAIESNDSQALDLLSTPSACIVYLERVMQENSEGWRNTCEPCGQAVFWPSTEGAPAESSYRRYLMGEIHLKASLQPSSAVFDFLVEVGPLCLSPAQSGLIQLILSILWSFSPSKRRGSSQWTTPRIFSRSVSVCC
jgi:hypothetical protein